MRPDPEPSANEPSEMPTPRTDKAFRDYEAIQITTPELRAIVSQIECELEIAKSCERMMCEVARQISVVCGLDTENAEPPDVIEAVKSLRKAAEAARVALANCIGELEEREWEYHGTFGDSWHSCPSCSVMQGSPHEPDCGIDRRIKEATAALASLRSELVKTTPATPETPAPHLD